MQVRAAAPNTPYAVTLSVCAIMRDEAALMRGMLNSVREIADEIVVGVDTRTIDETAQIASGYGAKIIDVDWRDDFSYARNLTLSAATGEWVLVLDADEHLLPGGAAVVRHAMAGELKLIPNAVGLAFVLVNFDLDGGLHAIQVSSGRLWRNQEEIRYSGIVHEEPVWLPDVRHKLLWAVMAGDPQIAHFGCDPTLWNERGKAERNRALLERRIAADPSDEYARTKLAQLMAIHAAAG